MNRQFKLHDPEWGEYTVFVIHKYEDGNWQEKWDIFRTDEKLSEIGDLFSRVSFEAYQDALRGHSLPLIKELGLEPYACFLKTREAFLKCALRSECAMHDPENCLGDENPPPCFEADISEDNTHLRTLTARIFELWRMGFYIIVAPAQDM